MQGAQVRSLVRELDLTCMLQLSPCATTTEGALGTRASVVVAHGLSCSVACGIFPNQGSNPCPRHW